MKSHTHRFRVAKTSTHSVNITSTEHYLHAEAYAQACSRCRRMKKKCSKVPPACELCVQGGHVCSLTQLAATQELVANIPESPGTIRSINSTDGLNHDIAQVLSPHNAERRMQNMVTASTFDGTYLSYVHAYFRHVHRAYPFLDKQEILRDAKASAYLNLWAEDNPDSIASSITTTAYAEMLTLTRSLVSYSPLVVRHWHGLENLLLTIIPRWLFPMPES